jgi:hypothetical protein
MLVIFASDFCYGVCSSAFAPSPDTMEILTFKVSFSVGTVLETTIRPAESLKIGIIRQEVNGESK